MTQDDGASVGAPVIGNKRRIILELLASRNEWTLDSDLNALSGGALGSIDNVWPYLSSLKHRGLIECDSVGFCAITEAGKSAIEKESA
jgi:hypothetical protein